MAAENARSSALDFRARLRYQLGHRGRRLTVGQEIIQNQNSISLMKIFF